MLPTPTRSAGRNLVVGVDGGATMTRALVVSTEGAVLGWGRDRGCNILSSGVSVTEPLARAMQAALAGLDARRIASGVIGVSGLPHSESVRSAADKAWKVTGLRDHPRVVSDALVSFAAGTTAATGVVLIAGTGAIAVMIDNGRTTRRADGHGWILGDRGSAVWMGATAVRATLAALDGRGPPTDLAELIEEELAGGAAHRQDRSVKIVEAIHQRPPAEMGLLAPLVEQAARAGDDVANRIVVDAAGHLLNTIQAVIGPTPTPTIVLSGGVVTESRCLVAEYVRRGIARRWPESAVRVVRHAVVGAVALAIGDVTGERITSDLHSRLTNEANALITAGGQ